MVTLLSISVLVLILVAVAVYLWQKPPNTSGAGQLPPPPPPEFKGLFSDFRLNELRPPAENQLPDGTVKITQEDFEQAVKAIRDFQQSPNKTTTAKLLHVAALTDNAKNYGRAIELVLLSWRDGSLADISAKDLQALINSEYWVLSSRTRTSGSGFVLKDTLSNANRELETTNNPT